MIISQRGGHPVLTSVNPLSKAFLFLISVVVSALFAKLALLLAITLGMLILLLVSRIPYKVIRKSLGWYVISLAPLLVLFEWLEGTHGWYLSWMITYARLVDVVVAGFLYIQTTDPSDLTLCMLKFGRLRNLAIAFSVGIRFLPVFVEKIQNIVILQRQRGALISFRKILPTLRNVPVIIIPTVMVLFEIADEVSRTLTVRGYNTRSKVTLPDTLKLGARDAVLVVVGAGLILGSVV